MKGKKIITIWIIINILLIGIIYNFIKKDYLNNEKIIIKAMTDEEYEGNITSLNQSHMNYANYVEASKTKIASAITDMGVNTSNDASPETMSSNIRSIARNASSISYDNTDTGLISTNVQGAVDELNDSLGEQIKRIVLISVSFDNLASEKGTNKIVDLTSYGFTKAPIPLLRGTRNINGYVSQISTTEMNVYAYNPTASAINGIVHVTLIEFK